MESDQNFAPPAERRVGLVDYALAIADHVKLLALLPLLLAAIVFGATWLAPKEYTSVALISIPPNDQGASGITPPQAATMMKSRPVLDTVVAARIVEGDVMEVADRIDAAVGKEGMVRLEATGRTPAQAQRLAGVVLQAWTKTTLPGERERVELVARAEQTKANLANVQGAIESLTRALGAGERTVGDSKLRLADLSETADKLFVTLQAVERRLGGLPPDVVRQPPSLPERPTFPRPVSAAAKTWIASFVLLLLLIVALRRMEAARTDPAIEAKMARLFPRRSKAREVRA